MPGSRPGKHSLMASASSCWLRSARDDEEDEVDDEEDDLDAEEEEVEDDDPAEMLGVAALRGNVPGRMSGRSPPELDDDEEDEEESRRGYGVLGIVRDWLLRADLTRRSRTELTRRPWTELTRRPRGGSNSTPRVWLLLLRRRVDLSPRVGLLERLRRRDDLRSLDLLRRLRCKCS